MSLIASSRKSVLLLCWCLTLLHQSSLASLPAPPQFFAQLVNHLPEHSRSGDNDNHYHNNNNTIPQYYPQRYYTSEKYFGGPGSPIFLILGGEGATEPEQGIYYDVVAETWAARFQAAVVQPEHRFYGTSQPVSKDFIVRARTAGRPDPRVDLLTPEQALYDAVRLVQHLQYNVYHCSPDKASVGYCPVLAIGGSYPGFLAATIRLRFPTVIDAAYAASAPMRFYSQQTAQSAYYQHVSKIANQAVSNCTTAVRDVLTRSQAAAPTNASDWGLCAGTVPDHVANDPAVLAQEVVMMVAILFANANMGYYNPPTPTKTKTTRSENKKLLLVQACHHFVQHQADPDAVGTVRKLLVKFLLANHHHHDDNNNNDNKTSFCLNMTSQLPSGPHATVSAGDWSGVGNGPSGESWDWQTCTQLVEAIGFGDSSSTSSSTMFPPRRWSLDWLTRHCTNRFNVTPQPHLLVQKWRFDNAGLRAQNASYILFTNGRQDAWSVSAVDQNLTDTVVVVNFPTGAHHSDLSAPIHDPALNTADINRGRAAIGDLLEQWLREIRQNYQYHNRQKRHQQRQPANRTSRHDSTTESFLRAQS